MEDVKMTKYRSGWEGRKVRAGLTSQTPQTLLGKVNTGTEEREVTGDVGTSPSIKERIKSFYDLLLFFLVDIKVEFLIDLTDHLQGR